MYAYMKRKQKYTCLGNRKWGGGERKDAWLVQAELQSPADFGDSRPLTCGHREALRDHFKSKAAGAINSNRDCWEVVMGVPTLASQTENNSGSPLTTPHHCLNEVQGKARVDVPGFQQHFLSWMKGSSRAGSQPQRLLSLQDPQP